MENQGVILKQKAEEIQQQLTQWVLESGILQPGDQIIFSMKIKKIPIVVREEESEILSMSIQDFFNENRVKKFNENCGHRIRRLQGKTVQTGPNWESKLQLNTVGDLLKVSADDVADWVINCGPITINSIKEILSSKGIEWH